MAMANKKKTRAEIDDVDQIKNDVELFASSVGLSTALPSSGFNDSDFQIKHILQVALQPTPQYACGCLFLLSEVLKARPPLWHLVVQNESIDDEIEHFDDAPDETDNQPTTVTKETKSDEIGEDAKESSLNEIVDDEEDDDDEEEAVSSAEENDSEAEADLIKENSLEYTEAKLLNHSSDFNGIKVKNPRPGPR